jgi:hypothetical protein
MESLELKKIKKGDTVKFYKYKILSVVGSLAFSSLGFAYDFKKADELFRKRAEGAAKATEARGSYAEALGDRSLSVAERVYAVSQMSRLDLYKGAMVPNVSTEDKKTTLESCISNLDTNLAQTKSQEYYYYYLACVAFRGKIEERNTLPWALKLKRVYSDALASLSGQVPYEGGGIYRVLSAVKGNSRADALGLYDPDEAIKFAKKALETESTQVRPYPDALSGRDYHENFYYLGRAELGLAMKENDAGKAKQALKTIKEAMSNLDTEIEEGILPQGREPETNYYRREMEATSNLISGCLKKDAQWKVCLIKELK